jgi:16S rRNA (adenine1518-N6/adenine1519-N6)-dimethyltransferase
LHVVEIDRDVVPQLRAVCGDAPGLHLHLADALKFDYGSLAAPGQPLRLVGNLPYNISTPLLFHLLRFAPQVRDMHFMLQKEVVDRMAAAPGGKDYGRLSVMLQWRYAIEAVLDKELKKQAAAGLGQSPLSF